MASIECAGFSFYSNFDSGNLQRVEWVPKSESAVVAVKKNGNETPDVPDIEFNLWTKPDCMGTEFENGNRTWFHFGIKGYMPNALMKLNLVDLNRQAKLFSLGMAPVFKVVPGKGHWERIREKPTYTVLDGIFTLSFKVKTPENVEAVMYFAFTYPYTYIDLQTNLASIDSRFLSRPGSPHSDDIYYLRECVCKSLEGRRVDLITISSYYNIIPERETRLMHLFPDRSTPRPFKFSGKKVIFVSARVHPGETPSSFVFNGLLNFLLNKEDPIACMLRRLYVFKMIPFLNPDGVVRGHYRTDTRGVNLNRMYLNPTLAEHPSVYAARALIMYYHNGFDKEQIVETFPTYDNHKVTHQVEGLTLDEKASSEPWCTKWKNCETCHKLLSENEITSLRQKNSFHLLCSGCLDKMPESGIFMYLDMHGHASKKGIFIYGNHFDEVEKNVECMLLPKIMSLNNYNFHFTACNFTERNMYLKDRRDGMSREGSGRVAVLKLTGLIKSYTLECNYNSGRMVNVLPPGVKEGNNKTVHTLPLPPKYTPQVFEEVGKAFGASILDLTGNNPNSRIPNSEFHTLNGLRDWLRLNCMHEIGFGRPSRFNKTPVAQNQKPLRCKSMKNLAKSRSSATTPKKQPNKSANIPVDRKENAYGSRDNPQSSSSFSASSSTNSRVFNRSASKSKGLSLRGRKRDTSKHKKLNSPETPSNRNVPKQISSRTVPKQISNRHVPKQISTISDRSVQTSTSITKFKQDSELVIKDTKKPTAEPDNSDRLKLREICFIKHNLNKKLIAKFTSTDSNSQETHDDDDDLVVAWDSSFSPKIMTKADNRPSTSKSGKPGYKSTFVSVKTKRNKGTLRRLTTPTMDARKIDGIKKRKKIKSKIL